MKFTEQEFRIMTDELLNSEKPKFDMLCSIAYKTLEKKVAFWCSVEGALDGKCLEGGVMQEIMIRLIQKTVTCFLKRDGADGPVNYDPEGFEDWMFKVALNVKRGFAKKARLCEGDAVGDELLDTVAVYEDFGEELDAQRMLITSLFEKVVHMKIGVQKTVTWIGMNIYMLASGRDRIAVTNAIEKNVSDITLNEFFELILIEGRSVAWLRLTPEQQSHIRAELEKEYTAGKTYGETVYGDFYSANGGKATISDWYYKINKKLREDK